MIRIKIKMLEGEKERKWIEERKRNDYQFGEWLEILLMMGAHD